MKLNDLINGEISRFDYKGRGTFDIILLSGKTRPMVVPFTTIGDEIKARLVRRERQLYVGRLERIIKPGPDRVEPPFAHPENHPGAPWLHINYEAQLRFKRDLINQAFESAGLTERVTRVEPCPSFDRDFRAFYRNRMDYVFGPNGELGLKEAGNWRNYLNMTNDILLSEEANQVLAVCRELQSKFQLKAWDNRRDAGDLRYVVIREGKNTGQRLVALIVKNLSQIPLEAKNFFIKNLDKLATHILIGENPLITDLSIAKTIEILKGGEMFEEVINGTRYKIHLNSFFQTNSLMAARLQDVVWDALADFRHSSFDIRHSILDLYCGLGFFGINFATRDPNLKIYGFEIDAQAIELAKHNAQQNNVGERCQFKSGAAEDLSWKNLEAQAVIVDPPRAGLHPRVLQTLVEKKYPLLVYVSCKYTRLVEELRILKNAYRIESVAALDLFPHTQHVEVIAKLVASS